MADDSPLVERASLVVALKNFIHDDANRAFINNRGELRSLCVRLVEECIGGCEEGAVGCTNSLDALSPPDDRLENAVRGEFDARHLGERVSDCCMGS